MIMRFWCLLLGWIQWRGKASNNRKEGADPKDDENDYDDEDGWIRGEKPEEENFGFNDENLGLMDFQRQN